MIILWKNHFLKKKNFSKRRAIINNLKKIIHNSKKINVKYHVFPLVDNSRLMSNSEERDLIKETKKLLRCLNKDSKILFEIDYKPELIIPFIKKFKSNKIGINYDTGNSAGLNYDFRKEIKYFKYVYNVHIKDRILNGTTVRLGKGNWKYKTFFQLIKRNYKGNFIFQTARNNKNDLKELLINKNFFQNGIK